MEYKQPVSVSSVTLHVYQNINRLMFPPEAIEIWGGMDKKHLQLLGSLKPEIKMKKGDRPVAISVTCEFSKQKVAVLRVRAKPLTKIPAILNSKPPVAPNQQPSPTLLLIDEMLIN